MRVWFPSKSNRQKKPSRKSGRTRKKKSKPGSGKQTHRTITNTSGSASTSASITKSIAPTFPKDASKREAGTEMAKKANKKKKEDVEKHKKDRDTRKDAKEEKEEREHDDEVENKNNKKKKTETTTLSCMLDAPKKLDIRNQEVDQKKMKLLLVKFRQEKLKPQKPLAPLDAKERLLMDRVVKKPYPLKYSVKDKTMLVDEASSFFRPTATHTKHNGPISLSEEFYSRAPKWSEVKNLPEIDVLTADGQPYWAVLPEPSDDDMKDVDPPISVGSQHVEMFNDKKFELKSIKDADVLLDEWQPLVELAKRDEVHFHPHLVFSNTIRSLINVQQSCETSLVPKSSDEGPCETSRGATFIDPRSPVKYAYSRKHPIESARLLLARNKRDDHN